jgi:hypothetical protein
VLRDSLLLFCGTARETVGTFAGKQKGRAAVWKLDDGWSAILWRRKGSFVLSGHFVWLQLCKGCGGLQLGQYNIMEVPGFAVNK